MMSRKRFGIVTVGAVLALGLITPTVSAASSGSNSGSTPDRGNCLGNFVNQGWMGSDVSNNGHAVITDLGQFIGKEEHGCRD
jgi:hypothetical protein